MMKCEGRVELTTQEHGRTADGVSASKSPSGWDALSHTQKVVQSIINYFDTNALADAAGIRLPNVSRKGLEKLIREIQDEARI